VAKCLKRSRAPCAHLSNQRARVGAADMPWSVRCAGSARRSIDVQGVGAVTLPLHDCLPPLGGVQVIALELATGVALHS
jgi:hypothetical protein